MSAAPTPRPRAGTFKRVLSLARPELRTLALATLCLAVGSVMGLLFPLAIRALVDGAIGPGKSRALVDRATGMLLVVALIQAVAIGLRALLFSTAGERIVARLRATLFERLLEQEVAFFDERRTGELTSRLGSDTTVIQSAVSTNISMGLRFVASVVGGIAFLFYSSPRLTLLMLSVVPPVALGAFAYGRRVQLLGRDVQDSLAKANEVAEETLGGLRTVRAFAAEKASAKRYADAVFRSFAIARRRSVFAGIFVGASSFAAYAAAALVLWYGGYLVTEGRMTIGELTSFLVYTLLVAVSLGGLSDLMAELMKAGGAAERIFELLDRSPAIPTSGGLTLAEVQGRIEFERVEFHYPARKDAPVLRGIDVVIRPGEVVALVGASGAGKSTIAALLLRLYDPDAGLIRLDGHDLRDLDPSWLRRRIGIVAQEPILFSGSIADNIRYGRVEASDAEVEAAARTANAHDFITTFPGGYATLVGERGVQLSGGQKQRVAIARAVLKDPRLLIFDEATSALDAESEHLVKEALDRLMQGRTTLVVAHRLSTVKHADRVLVMEGGRIVQSGDHAALVSEPGLYRRLVERQFVSA